jgi:hypothetical protein
MAIDLSELEEEYEKYINTPSYENMTLKPPASCSPATYPQTGSSMLSVCPTGLAALDCRALLNTSVGEIVCSPVALSHGFGSKSWPIVPASPASVVGLQLIEGMLEGEPHKFTPHSMVKHPAWQCPNSAPTPPQGGPGSSGWLS